MDIDDLKGKVIIKIKQIDNRELIFICEDRSKYKMYHDQDCCEEVTLEDIVGNLDDLLNSPITIAEKVVEYSSKLESIERWHDSFTWTFYKLATIKGYVTLRWFGGSNGYYSESVDFIRLN